VRGWIVRGGIVAESAAESALPFPYIPVYTVTYDVIFWSVNLNKKLSYRRGTARCVVSIEILPIATQQCRNYLYDKS